VQPTADHYLCGDGEACRPDAPRAKERRKAYIAPPAGVHGRRHLEPPRDPSFEGTGCRQRRKHDEPGRGWLGRAQQWIIQMARQRWDGLYKTEMTKTHMILRRRDFF